MENADAPVVVNIRLVTCEVPPVVNWLVMVEKRLVATIKKANGHIDQ